MVKIYVLKNPITNAIHYVGRSVNPSSRYRNHIHLAIRAKHKNKKDAWICSLLNQNLKPLMEIIDSVSNNKAIEKEKFWIEKLRLENDLKNSRDYLENNYLFSVETRIKMAEAARRTCNRRGTKTSIEGKKRIGDSKRGIKQSKHHIEKKSKIVLQFTKNSIFVKEWSSTKEASKFLKISQGTISSAALGKRKTCGGFIWKYKIS
jgi:hypothetical protein